MSDRNSQLKANPSLLLMVFAMVAAFSRDFKLPDKFNPNGKSGRNSSSGSTEKLATLFLQQPFLSVKDILLLLLKKPKSLFSDLPLLTISSRQLANIAQEPFSHKTQMELSIFQVVSLQL